VRGVYCVSCFYFFGLRVGDEWCGVMMMMVIDDGFFGYFVSVAIYRHFNAMVWTILVMKKMRKK
jgi:hypothetical protein